MTRLSSVLALALLFTACAADAESDGDQTAGEPASSEAQVVAEVTIVEPAHGAAIEGSTVRVRLEASGVRIVQAGDTTSGTGHHHIFLDDDLSPAGQPVPSIPGRIVHMGDGSAEYVFEDVAEGEHRLIAVVADGVHVPLQPWVVDTVSFTVRR
jgi:hypothetical protein